MRAAKVYHPEPAKIRSAKLTHVRDAQKCAMSDLDAVFESGILTRPSLIYQCRFLSGPFQVAQYTIG